MGRHIYSDETKSERRQRIVFNDQSHLHKKWTTVDWNGEANPMGCLLILHSEVLLLSKIDKIDQFGHLKATVVFIRAPRDKS